MPFHHAILPNGLTVIGELDDQTHSVAFGFFVRAGSRDEPPELSGISHFLEHMCFKGSERRDSLAVNRELDRIGAKHNAQTSEEDTVYYLCCLPEHTAQAFEIMADILRPSLRKADFETEKQVILEEIQMYADDPMSVAFEDAKALHFGAHPLGRSVLGTEQTVGSLRVEQMRDYFQRYYGAGNMTLAVAGRADWGEVLALAERHCGSWRGEPALREVLPARGSHQFRTRLRSDDQQETLVAVADAPPSESLDRYPAALLATIMGDHTGSRLYWALIDPGHADAAEVSYQPFDGAGCAFTFVSCDPEHAPANLTRLRNELQRLQAEGPSPDELEQAKNKTMARIVLRNERTLFRLMSLGYYWSHHRQYLSQEEELQALASVTLDDVARVLRAYPIWPETVYALGPRTDLQPPG
ncbi:MAG: zinc protease [Isosphaeraceae bacterium]|jgi:predicted Zn-dependent peptidase|nr:MAG: zinc protease [Isosphaeraceae bacterium]